MGMTSPPPAWTQITGKPNTVAGFGITDMASQTVANATNCVPKDVGSNGVGQIAYCSYGLGSAISAGGTTAGSSLTGVVAGVQFSGTWRFLDPGSITGPGASGNFQRIA